MTERFIIKTKTEYMFGWLSKLLHIGITHWYYLVDAERYPNSYIYFSLDKKEIYESCKKYNQWATVPVFKIFKDGNGRFHVLKKTGTPSWSSEYKDENGISYVRERMEPITVQEYVDGFEDLNSATEMLKQVTEIYVSKEKIIREEEEFQQRRNKLTAVK